MSATLADLTRQQRTIVPLIARGLGNKQIARQLNLSEHTVKNHITHLYDRLVIGHADCPRLVVALWYWRQVGLPAEAAPDA